MNDPTIFQIVSGVILAVVLLLLVAPRKRAARQLNAKTGPVERPKRGMEPMYCFNDCMRIQGPSRGVFCGIACGGNASE
jgi:hypothetical protein